MFSALKMQRPHDGEQILMSAELRYKNSWLRSAWFVYKEKLKSGEQKADVSTVVENHYFLPSFQLYIYNIVWKGG